MSESLSFAKALKKLILGGTMRFLIAGMTCEGCAKSVRRVIEKISGVGGAEISLEKNMAQVTTLTTVQPEEIIQAVRNAGYDAKQA